MILGIGLNFRASPEEAQALLAAMQIPPGTAIALPAFRASHRVADWLWRAGHALIALHPVQLKGVVTPSQSDRILALYGTGCLAEACALCACGPGAELAITRRLSPEGHITAALAVSQHPKHRQEAMA